jgi:hypothetical protein
VSDVMQERWDTLAPRLRLLAMHDPTIYSMVKYYLAGEIDTYESLLEQLVFYTCAEKQRMVSEAIRRAELKSTF